MHQAPSPKPPVGRSAPLAPPDAPAPASPVLRAGAAAWSAIHVFTFTVLPVLGVLALTLLVLREMREDDIEVAPIAVPARLAETGMTPEVTALRLLDQILAAEQTVHSEKLDRPPAELAGDRPDFSVPIAGLSLRSLAALLRSLTGDTPPRVTGEIVLENDRLKIRLRLAGHGQIVNLGGFEPDRVDDLLAAAAPEVWRLVHPRIYAWYVAQTEPNQNRVRERLGRMLRPGGGASDPDSRRTTRYLIGRSFIRSGRGEEALAAFEALLQDEPRYALGWFGRGRALWMLDRPEEALASYRRALALDQSASYAHAGVAGLHSDRGDYAAALAEAQQALGHGRTNPQALVEEAVALLGLGRAEEAHAAAVGATTEDPNNIAARTALGRTLLARGQAPQALAEFDTAIARSPAFPDPRLGRAEALLALERAEEARTELLVLRRMAPIPSRLKARFDRAGGAASLPDAS